MKQKLFEKNKKISQKTIIINRSNLTHNYQVIQKEAKNSSIICVVKGDAYGHGMLECSEKLIKNRVNNFYVARLEDALKLRKKFKKIKICVLAGVITKDCCREMIKNQITPIINNFDQLELFKKYNKKNKFILHLDTGMNRLGISNFRLKKNTRYNQPK
jgi:alanine racemase